MKNRNENNMNSLTHIEDEGPGVKIERVHQYGICSEWKCKTFDEEIRINQRRARILREEGPDANLLNFTLW